MHKDKAGRVVVTVCDRCLQACCWHGILMCDEAKGAGIVDLPIETLRTLAREHEDYWEEELQGERGREAFGHRFGQRGKL